MNTWDEPRLARLFRSYGEERFAGQIARAIVRRRTRAPLETTFDLVDTIKSAVPVATQFGRGHPAKRVFQAMRIGVNDELGALERGLPAAWDLLRPGGPARRHLLPFARGPAREALPRRARAGVRLPARLPDLRLQPHPEAELITGRAVAPTQGEVAANPRAASGKLRVARKLETGG